MTLKQQLISEVTKINTRLSYARNQLGKGEVVEIGSLEPEITKLCQRIKELPPDDATHLLEIASPSLYISNQRGRPGRLSR